jgi:hypothetical protein
LHSGWQEKAGEAVQGGKKPREFRAWGNFFSSLGAPASCRTADLFLYFK